MNKVERRPCLSEIESRKKLKKIKMIRRSQALRKKRILKMI